MNPRRIACFASLPLPLALPLALALALASSLAGCDDPGRDPTDASASDAAAADAGAPACTGDRECDDGLFCNGIERCAPGDEGANPRGCVAGAAPCAGRCDDSLDHCLVGCDVPDADGDGSAAEACGGDDCDDADPDRFPGNVELCDALGRDEDCDPSTLGHDLDRDGHVDDRCCNLQPDGTTRCGEDCDDLRDGVGPGAVDACNARDDDCDGAIDEEPALVFYRDADGDGWGVAGSPDDTTLPAESRPVRACTLPDGYSVQPGDCDDADVRAAPGSLELCGGGDEDCDDAIDEYGEGAATPAIDPRLWYRDDDGDGWGSTDRVTLGCRAPADGFRYTSRLGDCRDDRADVNPGVTVAVATPSCPESYTEGDYLLVIVPWRCGSHWECVWDGGGDPGAHCGETTFLDAVWDRDCSGALETFPEVPAYYFDGTACSTFATTRPRPDECGLGSHPESYGPPTPPPDCQATAIGTLGPVRCR